MIPGLKTCARGVTVSPEEAFLVNNVRGEETEILGILCETGLTDCAVLLPGTHTQAAVVENGRITVCSLLLPESFTEPFCRILSLDPA